MPTPTPELIYALDWSFSAPNITAEWCRDRIAEGYELGIANLWTGNQSIPGTEQSLRLWREAGGKTAGYLYIFDGAADRCVDGALQTAGDEWPFFQWAFLDIERSEGVATIRRDTIQRAVDRVTAGWVGVGGKRAVIYTSWGNWEAMTGSDTSFQWTLLWDAEYSLGPSLDMSRLYGGWTKRMGHQYQNTTTIDGIEVDISVFDRRFVMGDQSQQTNEVLALDRLWTDTIDLALFNNPRAVRMQQDLVTLKQALGLQAPDPGNPSPSLA